VLTPGIGGTSRDDAVLARHFTDQVLAALLRNRGLLVLHANAVQTPDGVVVIAGESGSGKSTTLAALLRRGCRMLSDDVTALRPGAAPGLIDVVPGAVQIQLTQDAAEGLGYAVNPAQLQPWRRMKTAVSARDSMTGHRRRQVPGPSGVSVRADVRRGASGPVPLDVRGRGHRAVLPPRPARVAVVGRRGGRGYPR
jgi:hypothetical protein